MTLFAADDFVTIHASMAYEAGFCAGADGLPADVPSDCKNAEKWREGHRDGVAARLRKSA
jgi:hypothetical protein